MAVEFQILKGKKPVAGNIPIWRYMGLEKFLDLIVSNRVRFVRASLLSDKRELSLPLDTLESEYYGQFLEKETLRGDDDPAYAKLREMRKRISDLKDRVFLNCWSIGHHESYALWKIYLGGSRAGVAIKSSVAALRKAFRGADGRDVYVSRVSYTDKVETEGIPDDYFITTKSTHYEYEKELRLFTFKDARNDDDLLGQRFFSSVPDAMRFKVDANTLISEIYLSPFVISGFQKTFEQIVRKVNPDITAKVRVSTIRDS